ncbi:hypothetical protein Tco_1177943 [Tanacetum coccineum]
MTTIQPSPPTYHHRHHQHSHHPFAVSTTTDAPTPPPLIAIIISSGRVFVSLGLHSNKGAYGFVISTKEGALGLKPPQHHLGQPGGLGSRGGGKPRRVCWFAGFTAGGCWVLAAKQPLAAFGFELGLTAGCSLVGFGSRVSTTKGCVGFSSQQGCVGLGFIAGRVFGSAIKAATMGWVRWAAAAMGSGRVVG